MAKLESLFSVTYPAQLVFGHQDEVEGGIPFVTSRGTNNGVAGFVKPIKGATLYPAGSITVPMKGTVLAAFLQPTDFYCAHQIAVLVPKIEMTEEQKLFYVYAIRRNQYRYNYGRQADRSLRGIELPSIDDLPSWVVPLSDDFSVASKAIIDGEPPALSPHSWALFPMGEIFSIKRGARITKLAQKPGSLPFIGAVESKNGVTGFIDADPLHPGGTITVNYNGSVAEAFFQPTPYWCSDDVNVLYHRDGSPFLATVGIFVATVIRREKYRFNYGRKWNLERMKRSSIRLPTMISDGAQKPDWEAMDFYVRHLPFSSCLL